MNLTNQIYGLPRAIDFDWPNNNKETTQAFRVFFPSLFSRPPSFSAASALPSLRLEYFDSGYPVVRTRILEMNCLVAGANKSVNYILLDRENLNLDFDTSLLNIDKL